MLHGNPDTADGWDEVIARLEDDYRCVAPDLPGFGESDAGDFAPDLERMARFVAQVRHVAGVTEPMGLVVHDFGAWFGLAWAIRHPQEVKAIAILNARFFSDLPWHPWARLVRTPVLGEVAMAAMTRRGFRSHLRRRAPLLRREQIDAIYDRITPEAKQMALRLYRAMDPGAFRGWEDPLRRLAATVPTIVLWGERDPYIPARYAERFGAGTVKRYPECSHWPHREAPDRVAADLRAFLQAAERP